MPIDKTKFIEQFRAETKEHLENLNKGFLELEKNSENPELLNDLMREAHTIKGLASTMGYEFIAEIAHKMEDGFDRAPGQDIHIQKEHFDLLFESLDAIESLLEGVLIRRAKALNEQYVISLCDQLSEAFNPEKPASNTAESQQADDVSQPEMEVPVSQTHENTSSDDKVSQEVISKSQDSSWKSIRVEIGKLDNLMNLSGEILIAKIQLKDLIQKITENADKIKTIDQILYNHIQQLNIVDDSINSITGSIQQEVLNLRMIPVSYLLGTFPRVMRDLAKEQLKDVEFSITGEETHLDKSIIDELKAPLMHLLRNAVDHGIELPEKRRQKGKSAAGKITINAYQVGSQVAIEVSDDGEGIDVERVKSLAVERGMLSKEQAKSLTDEQAFQLIFTPGFTTTTIVTETSGRGVGLDVVSDSVRKLKGTIEVCSASGRGTTFIIKLPLSLSITKNLLIASGDDIFAIPIENIAETTRIASSEIETVGSKEVITVRDQIISLVRIHQMFQLPKKGIIERNYLPVVVLHCAQKKVGLLVDEVLKHQDIVIKPLGYPLRNTQNIAGGTVLGDGRVVLVLDAASIIDYAENGSGTKMITAVQPGNSGKHRAKTVLLAEDSLTTAMLEKNVLETAGFSVVIARDGEEAFHIASGEKFDLVISDVLMPKMNGFELTAKLKKDEYYKDIPVIIVTTRESNEDKQRGIHAGADAYILKKDFTSDYLLETIERLIN